MSDMRDVVRTRSEADSARADIDAYGGRLEDAGTGDPALAIMLAARAVCLELRSLQTMLDYEIGQLG